VRGGDLAAPVEHEVADREVEHLRPDEPDRADVGTAGRRALDERLRHRGRRHSHVVSDRDLARLELLDVGAAYRAGAFLV
jgi:hypothetical protein